MPLLLRRADRGGGSDLALPGLRQPGHPARKRPIEIRPDGPEAALWAVVARRWRTRDRLLPCHYVFVRFRPTARRLQLSLIETHRSAGRVHHEHIAGLGSVPLAPSTADRIAFWTQLHERLGRLANRIDAAVHGAIPTAIHARIPMPTQEEQQAERLEMAKEDSRQQSTLAEVE